MMNARFNWHGNEAEQHVNALLWDHLRRAIVYYWVKLQEALNVPNPGQRRRRVRDTRFGKRGSTYTTYDNPAPIGQPPRKRTGWLQRHVVYELDERTLAGRAGLLMNAKYGLFLELGNHPWLVATLERYLPQIRAIARGGK